MEGWGPGQEKEPPMTKQGNGTFVPFVSSGCSRNARPPAGPPAVRPLGHSMEWSLGPDTVLFPPLPAPF